MSDDLQNAKNHFELFGLPVRYQLDRQLLSAHYLELTRATHPDFAGADAEAQIRALELSARVNEAYAILDDDLRRAEYLLQLRGAEVGEAKLPPEVLERVFELRESLSLAQSSEDEQGIAQARDEASHWLNELMAQIGRRLDGEQADNELRQLVQAARYVRRVCNA